MKSKANQQGVTLMIAMIFLILMSLFAASAFKSSTSNLRIIGNMQSRQEAIAVGKTALEKTLSSSEFSRNPVGVAATPVTVDIDGDGTVDYTAMLNPQPYCYRTKAIKSSELNPALAADLSCLKSSGTQNSGLDTPGAAAVAGNSLCANSEWNIAAQVVDARSGAKVVINQGVAVRVLDADAANSCL
jgi:Tfp pilus assembly protein PilX